MPNLKARIVEALNTYGTTHCLTAYALHLNDGEGALAVGSYVCPFAPGEATDLSDGRLRVIGDRMIDAGRVLTRNPGLMADYPADPAPGRASREITTHRSYRDQVRKLFPKSF